MESDIQIIGTSTQELLTNLKIIAKVAVQPIKEEDDQFDVQSEDNSIARNYLVEISGDNLGILIGYHGETLQNFQYLLSLIINRKLENHIRILVDIDGWRSEREETIKNLVKNTINKVQATQSEQSLPPMTSYERRLVHKLISKETDLISYSKGEGQQRATYIALKAPDSVS